MSKLNRPPFHYHAQIIFRCVIIGDACYYFHRCRLCRLSALAALYRTARHRLYAAHMEGNPKVTAAQARSLFVEFCYTGHQNAVNLLDVPRLFQDLGYINPTKRKLRVPFQFAVPQRADLQRGDASAPKPKPKPNPKPVSRQLSMSHFSPNNWTK